MSNYNRYTMLCNIILGSEKCKQLMYTKHTYTHTHYVNALQISSSWCISTPPPDYHHICKWRIIGVCAFGLILCMQANLLNKEKSLCIIHLNILVLCSPPHIYRVIPFDVCPISNLPPKNVTAIANDCGGG